MGFLKSLFGGKTDPEAEKEKNEKKNFDILKYDGIRAMRIGKPAYAIKCFEEATALREDLETMQHQANAYIRVERMDDARALLNRMTEIAPDQPQVYQTLASLCYMQEDYTGMDEACRKALELDDKNPATYLLAAKAAIGTHNGIEAVATLTKAILLDENFIEAYQFRAEVLWNYHQCKEAEEDVDKLLAMNPEDETALLLKAEMIAVAHQDEEAIGMIDRILSMNPFNEKAYLLKGGIYLEDKMYDEAIAVYDEALELIPNFAKGYHERGRVKLHKGDKEGSMADMKRTIELAPEKNVNITGEYHNFEMPKNIPF